MATSFPCFSIARFSTRTRRGFALVILTVLALYFGGIASFIVASRVADPVVTYGSKRVEMSLILSLAWGTYIGGPWVTVAQDGFLWFVWTVHSIASEADPENEIYAGTTSTLLLVVHFGVQLVLAFVIASIIGPQPGVEAYQSLDQNASPSLYGGHAISFGWLDRIEPSFMATCFPCFSIARFSTSTRLDFSLAFLAVLTLYLGGIASFIVASRVADPVVKIASEEARITHVVAFAWGSYIVGPWATVTMDCLLWVAWFLYHSLSEDDPQDRVYAGTTSTILLVVHFGVQLVLVFAISKIIFKLRANKSRSDTAWGCWGCYCCCCTSCALGSTITSARKTQATSHDEIPAYHAYRYR